jgi:hypothetical protein
MQPLAARWWRQRSPAALRLKVLERPEIPLRTNGSENDIRCQVNGAKVSGGTRSDRNLHKVQHRFKGGQRIVYGSSATMRPALIAPRKAFQSRSVCSA